MSRARFVRFSRLALVQALVLLFSLVLPGAALATEEPDAGPAGDYVVIFTNGVTPAEQSDTVAGYGAESVGDIPALRMQVVRATASQAQALAGDPSVISLEADEVREAGLVPDDASYGDQWALPLIGWGDAYGSIEPSGSAVVAILDTGVDAAHPDLAGTLVTGRAILEGGSPTSDPSGHGTALAGIVAANANNGVGIAGVGYAGVKVMPVSVLDSEGTGQDSDIIEGIVWAVQNGADVILMAFSNPGYSAALQIAVDYAWNHNVVLVAAVGNDGSAVDTFPAGTAGVVGVGATNASDAAAGFSNSGDSVFIAAPGVGIPTTEAGGGVAFVSGTSAAAAHVAAVAALVFANDPGVSNDVVVARLARNAEAVGSTAETGNGRLDLFRALTDQDLGGIKPRGAAAGGPFVGPYVAAAISNILVRIDGAPKVVVGPNEVLPVTVQASVRNTADPKNWNSTGWVLATSAPGSTTKLANCVDTVNAPGTDPATIYVRSFSITAHATPGTRNLYTALDSDDGTGAGACGDGGNSNQVRNELKDAVTVLDVSATLDGAAAVSVAPGATILAAVTFTNADPVKDWKSTGWQIPTAALPLPSIGDQLTNCFDTADSNGSGATATRSFSITAPTTPGTYSVYFGLDPDNGTGASACGDDASKSLRFSLVNAITVEPAGPADVTVDFTAANKVYDGTDTATITGCVLTGVAVGDDATCSFAGATATFDDASVGVGKTVTGVGFTIAGAQSADYAVGTINTTSAEIMVRAVEVTADDRSRTYGDADPALTYSVTSGSLVVGDSFSGALARVAGEDVGGYAITQGTLALDGNYDLTFVPGTLTITKRAIEVTADDASKVLNAPDPVFGYAITGGSLVFGDTFTGALSRVAGEVVGPYAINQGSLAIADGNGGANYDLSVVEGTLTIVYAADGLCLGSGGHQILQPIDANGMSVFKRNSTIPAKFRVCDADGVSIGTPGVVAEFKLIKVFNGLMYSDVNEPVTSTTPDSQFRWSDADGQWIFNINTKALTAGKTYVYKITLNDGSTIEFQFGLK